MPEEFQISELKKCTLYSKYLAEEYMRNVQFWGLTHISLPEIVSQRCGEYFGAKSVVLPLRGRDARKSVFPAH